MKKVAMYVNTYVGVRDVEIGKEQDTVREIGASKRAREEDVQLVPVTELPMFDVVKDVPPAMLDIMVIGDAKRMFSWITRDCPPNLVPDIYEAINPSIDGHMPRRCVFYAFSSTQDVKLRRLAQELADREAPGFDEMFDSATLHGGFFIIYRGAQVKLWQYYKNHVEALACFLNSHHVEYGNPMSYVPLTEVAKAVNIYAKNHGLDLPKWSPQCWRDVMDHIDGIHITEAIERRPYPRGTRRIAHDRFLCGVDLAAIEEPDAKKPRI